MLSILFTAIWLAIAVTLFNLGLDYHSLGYGLHPVIAFPFSVVALTIALYFDITLIKEYHHDPLRSSTRYHSTLGK